jgi:hypothetical protein
VSNEREKDLREVRERSASRREDALDVFLVLVDGDFVPAGGMAAQVQWWNYLSFVASGLGAATRAVRSLFAGQLEELSSRLDAQYPDLRGEVPERASQLEQMSAANLLINLLAMGVEPSDRTDFVHWAVDRRHALAMVVDRLALCAEAWNGLMTGADRRGRTVLRVSARSEPQHDTRTGFD